jgi:cytosine/adenosine deaminase-related metal-dependent hydrolase
MSFQSYTARWILTAAGSPVENGILVVRDDKIEAVEPKGTCKADVDLGNVALIPGLVNAHTHLDLSGARGLIPPTDPEHFTDWLKGVIAYRRTRTPEQLQRDIREGLAESMKAGTTLIGDITSGGASWDVVARSDVRSVLFWEIIGLTEERYSQQVNLMGELTGTSLNAEPPFRFPVNQKCRWELSPHSPYSANQFYSSGQLVLGGAIHLAESPGEIELLSSKSGPFVAFLQELGLWNPNLITATLKDYCRFSELFKKPQILVHANYLSPNVLLGPNHTIVYCPRTHAAFGHPPHPFREFMKRGVRVCLGTDSLASNPDLDILAEARFVKSRYPDFDGETLLKMVTLFGAEALGWADECGSLEAGKSADAVAVPLPDRDGDPYDLLFVDPTPGERRTMFRREWRTAGVSRAG